MAIEDGIKTLLDADLTLAAILTGGVWNRDLRRKGPGATPAAFSPDPPHQVRPSAVIIPQIQIIDEFGPVGGFFGEAVVRLYAPAHATGHTAINSAVDRIIAILHTTWIANGPHGVELQIGGREGVRDSGEVDGAVTDVVTVRFASIWGLFL